MNSDGTSMGWINLVTYMSRICQTQKHSSACHRLEHSRSAPRRCLLPQARRKTVQFMRTLPKLQTLFRNCGANNNIKQILSVSPARYCLSPPRRSRRRLGHSPTLNPLTKRLFGGSTSSSKKSSFIKMTAVQTLPKDLSKLGQEVKLFGKWDTQECVIFLLHGTYRAPAQHILFYMPEKADFHLCST